MPKLPEGLPEDLFTEQIGRETKGYLLQFQDGEIDREEVHKKVRDSVNIAMNAIAANQGVDVKEERLAKKTE